MTIDEKISYASGFVVTAITTVSTTTIMNALILAVFGGFGGLLGKEIYYAAKKRITSAKFQVWVIDLYDKIRRNK
jgi:transposase InsO family protein